MKKVILFWSGGKDSALALRHLSQDPSLKVIALFTTLDEKTCSNLTHGMPESLYQEQARLLNIPLVRAYLPENCSNEMYKKILAEKLSILKKSGAQCLAFGDIFLEDIKSFRNQIFSEMGFETLYPLWKKPDSELLNDFFENGYKAIVTSINEDVLDSKFLNKEYNREWIEALPVHVNPLGENGEFHTVLTYMPNFKIRMNYSKSMAKKRGSYLVTELREP